MSTGAETGVLGVVSECPGPSWVQSARRAREPSVARGRAAGGQFLDAAGRTDRARYRFERTRRAVRLADTDWYCALFQIAGRCAVTQNEDTLQLTVGDIGLVDGARPSTRLSESGAQWLSIYLPRQQLISRLGFEPQGCLYGHGGTLASRVLHQLVLDGIGDEQSTAPPAGPHMRLALYDLLGALFAPFDPGPVSRHANRLFARIRSVIKDRCADPDFGPAEVAAETGISLRYVQKLLTARGCTCSELVYSMRLDRAAHLLERRASLSTGQHLSEIAYACGFRDYAHFARRFRDRFGHAPGAHLAASGAIGTRMVRDRAGEHRYPLPTSTAQAALPWRPADAPYTRFLRRIPAPEAIEAPLSTSRSTASRLTTIHRAPD